MALIEDYKKHTEERAQLGVPPLPLNASQTAELVELLKQDSIAEKDYVLELFEEKVPAGVDDAAYVKAAFLNDIIQGNVTCEMITPIKACEILGKMLGGFNVKPLIEA
ncbi:MAG: aconitate hydratase B, partial [Sulfurovaceae bacterium]